MSQRTRASALGMPPLPASMLALGPAQTGLTATGTSSQSGAYAMAQGGSYAFSTTAANSGARLPYTADMNVGPIFVFNGGANALLLYPASGQNINASAADASFSITNGKGALCWPGTTTWWVILSA